ncbi:hypothetical protein BJY01DRAFT_232644 [Aspergillus pseudoustus]|uniref:Arylamine N-acetyltransferase n=1 Tax=Aspergillus pseudoustus TaxID=1810923 RepID=A0ABR4KJI1_9EURO
MTSIYTPDQLEAYLQRIRYADSASTDSETSTGTGTGQPRLQKLRQSIEQDALGALSELQRRHLGSIPWGNSAIHYSQHHSISTHPSAVFEKLVVRRLDGYCMENTNLLYGVLRSVGYQVYPNAGRVSKTPANPKVLGADVRYSSLSHMVLIVTIDKCRYMVDVGFGNNVPTRPLPLEENRVSINIAPSEMRLIKDSLPESVDQTQKAWIYQIRFSQESVWIPIYAFTEVEFLPQDFAMMNFQTYNLPSSWFTQMFACVQLILDEAGEELEGLYILAGKEQFICRRYTSRVPLRFSAFPAPRAMSTSLQEKLNSLQNYSACDVSDALLKLQKPGSGSPRAGHLADFTPFSPTLGRNTTTPKIIAPASTIKFIPKDSAAPSASDSQTFPPGTHWVDNTEPNTIVVIEQPASQHCAVVGGIMAVRMKYLGIRGIVVNGRIRDLAEIQGCKLPVWAKGTSTVGTGAEAKAGLRGVRVDVGGVGVEPGDIIFCDPLEGVVAIPRDLLDQVLEIMPKLIDMDDKVKAAVEKGSSAFDAFQKFRTKI